MSSSSWNFLRMSILTAFQEKLGSWCSKPSEPQRIISGLRETFTKRYIVERTNKVRQEELRKQRVVGRNYGVKYS